MTRQHLSFPCEGQELVGTLDYAEGEAGLLIVGGGNEIRAGAFSGMARLAARLATAGYPVLRFDRRGVGDSEGENRGFRDSGADIAAALKCFLAEAPHMGRVHAFGICDAASALMLNRGTGFHGLVLANPWTMEDEDSPPPPSAVRARYGEKLRNPAELKRLLTGKVSPRGLLKGLLQAIRPAPEPTSLSGEMAEGLATFKGNVRILLSDRDRTAQIFEVVWQSQDYRIERCPGASHAFAEPESADWLYHQLIETLSA